MLIDTEKYKWLPWEQPAFTSDTSYGTVSPDTVRTDDSKMYPAYLAFDGNPDTQWVGAADAEEATLTWVFKNPLRVYRIELVGTSSDTNTEASAVTVYADDEETVTVTSGALAAGSKSKVFLEPTTPMACDRLVFAVNASAGHAGLSEVKLIAEEGFLKIDLRSLYNTTEGMTCIRNSLNDDGTDTVSGLSGFYFNGTEATNLFVSGNAWIGYGVSSEQLQVLRRDGICAYLYRSTGVVGNGVSYLKLRWEGYTVYNSRVDANKLIFELILLSNNDMVLNVTVTPTGTSYLGNSALICGSKTTNLSLADGTAGTARVSFYHRDDKGLDWTVSYGDYEESDSFTKRFLVRSAGRYYRQETVAGTPPTKVLAAVDIADLTAAVFLKYGFSDVPEGSLLTALKDPDVLYWSSDASKIASTKALLKAYPYPQTMHSVIDMSDASITGIKLLSAEYTGHVGVRASFDNGSSYRAEVTLVDWLATDVKQLWSGLPTNKILLLDFILYEDAQFRRFKITYEN